MPNTMARSSSAPESIPHSMPDDTGPTSDNMPAPAAAASAASSSVPGSHPTNMSNDTSSTNSKTAAVPLAASSSEGRSAKSAIGKKQHDQPLEATKGTPSSKVAPAEEILVVAVLLCQISGLTKEWGTDLWSTLLPGVNEPSLKLQELSTALNLRCLYDLLNLFAPKKQGRIQPKHFLREDVMLRMFVSLAPILAKWKTDILDPEKYEDDAGVWENYAFIGIFPYAMEAELLASGAFCLPHIRARRSLFKVKGGNEHDILRSSPTLRKIAEVMKPYVMQYLDLNTFQDIERFIYELSARILIVAYLDLDTFEHGFFGVLLGSLFARPMSADAREQWEEYLGLTHKLEKGTSEYLNPFESIHVAVLALSEKWGSVEKQNSNDRVMKVTESAATSYERLFDSQRVIHAESDCYPRLLTAFDSTAPPLPPKIVPSRIDSAKQPQPKRVKGAKATKLTGGAASTAQTHTSTSTSTSASTSLEKIAALESDMHGSASETKRKAAAAPSSSDPDPPTHNKKQSRKAAATTSSDELTHPESQEDSVSAQPDAATDLQEDEEAVATTIEGTDEVPQLNSTPAPPPPVQGKRFATVDGRIVPSGRHINNILKSDCLTEKEQLALYMKYMEVVTRQRQNSGNQITAQLWYDLWQEVALFVPGRGVLKCIQFYVENKETFSF